MTRSSGGAALALALLLRAEPALAQTRPVSVSAESLRTDLFAIADDSMGGRLTGSIGNYKAGEWVAAALRRNGLEPAGESGSFFQTLPIVFSRRGDAAGSRYPVRNVVAVLRGSDPALSGTYVSLSAHNDHIGTLPYSVDHDSVRAYDRVVRPMGADSPRRPATPEEEVRIRAILDSLRAEHPPRRDSIFNGADDDGSGTVLLVELARVLSAGPRPRRSILFVSHAAEEIGLRGSEYFTDHPTVPRDSIVAELDMDMVGRGGVSDLPGGGPGYLELVGTRRLSTEFGDIIDSIGRHEPVPFRLNYAYDAPGNPLQYYCRADHYSYARYGIPSASLSTGEHLDYHQVTDEPQYIDYHQLARVTTLVRDVALAVANLDHRPVVDGRRQDPTAPCVQ
ncbi:MAG TPA: M28 family peptidase [Gemmatimonadales bacterium]|nr:M28 family peptidase [Gemmatimonadales bacterium]